SRVSIIVGLDNREFTVKVFIKRFANDKCHSKFCLPELQNAGGSVGIWGCINHKGAGCCSIYTGRINQFVYMDTLEN
ncbi:hypothetical protein BpHYR1_010164, partial [Brachionus plicatilis]